MAFEQAFISDIHKCKNDDPINIKYPFNITINDLEVIYEYIYYDYYTLITQLSENHNPLNYEQDYEYINRISIVISKVLDLFNQKHIYQYLECVELYNQTRYTFIQLPIKLNIQIATDIFEPIIETIYNPLKQSTITLEYQSFTANQIYHNQSFEESRLKLSPK